MKRKTKRKDPEPLPPVINQKIPVIKAMHAVAIRLETGDEGDYVIAAANIHCLRGVFKKLTGVKFNHELTQEIVILPTKIIKDSTL